MHDTIDLEFVHNELDHLEVAYVALDELEIRVIKRIYL
jgi:hypothetical protein